MHDTALAIVAPDGEPLFALSLERISRVKQDSRPPAELLAEMPWDRIAAVAVSAPERYVEPEVTQSKLHPVRRAQIRLEPLEHGPAYHAVLGAIPSEKVFVGHQEAHAASAFWGSGFEEALCLTYDGGMSNDPWFGGLFRCGRGTGIEALDRFSALHYSKVTTLYTFVTALLGFIPNRHEGKVTGLAAYGRPTERCNELLGRWFGQQYVEVEETLRWVFSYSEVEPAQLITRQGKMEPFAREIAGIDREDLAATVQDFAERHVLEILSAARDGGWHMPEICLAGGLFANVKINQRVVESGFEHLFIAPPMTDDGTALGAAWHVASRSGQFRPGPLRSIFLGPPNEPAAARALIENEGVRFTVPENPAATIADLLAGGAVVAVFQGASEFGPRALGNRSVLAQATEHSINRSLNDRLMRTEFMPFAPMTRLEDSAACYLGIDKVEHAAEFMTVTVECTESLKAACPGVVHVDGTARPQLVTPLNNPFMHQVLTHYVALTGRLAIVNTSFNIHEEPIVHTPADALRAFFESGLDCLYIEGVGVVSAADNSEAAMRYLRQRIRTPRQAARSLGAVVGSLSAECDGLEAELGEKESEIALLTTEVQERQRLIEQLTQESEERQRLIEHLTEESEERQRLIEELTEESAERLRVSEERRQLIDRLHDEMAARDQMVPRRDSQQTDRQLIAAEKDQTLAELEHALAQKVQVVETSHVALADLQVALARMETALGRACPATPDNEVAGPGRPAEMVPVTGLDRELQRHQLAIIKLVGTTNALQPGHSRIDPTGFLAGWLARIRVGFAPRLGRLNQHPRMPMRRITPYAAVTPEALLPVISVVTPSYQHGGFIERTLLSVLSQGYPKAEYIVQDGGSGDATVALLEQHGDGIAHWESRPDHGQSHAINLGFAHTTGQVMAWLNSDDLLLPGALACVGDYFARHPDVDVVYGDRLIINEDDMEVGRWILPSHDDRVLSWADFVPQETLFWRRSIWDKAGGQIDESFEFALDWDLLIRFRDVGARFAHLARFLAAFRVHRLQKTSAAITEVGFAEMNRIRERIHGRVPSEDEIRRALRPYLLRHVAVHLAHSLRTRFTGGL
jgi:predicted NodU family carbamoyl transferase/GT2 family glycosyltransferase